MIPTSTDVSISIKAAAPKSASALILFVQQDAKSVKAAAAGAAVEASANRLLSAGVARGKAKEIVFDLLDTGGKFSRVYLVGLGAAEKINAETYRQAGGTIVKALRKHKLTDAAIFIPADGKSAAAEVAESIVTGILLAAFDYVEYKGTASKKKDDETTKSISATFVAGDESEAKLVRAAVERAQIICDGQNFCRTIGWRPGNDINPPTLAKVSGSMAREAGLSVRIFDEKQLAKLGMGGILAVGAGSIHAPPRLIVLEHKPKGKKTRMEGKRARMEDGGSKMGKRGVLPSSIVHPPSSLSSQTLLVVGKAITFDTGGISIKPADKMGKMIFDKCGGMAVLGLMYAVAKLNLPIHVVGILSSAENSISSMAYRPGDVLRMYNGVTVEVTNTDAEGRLVLGDALAWGIETYKPAAVVDLATLTGGVIVALGKTMAGIMSNNDALVAELAIASESAGEKFWRLPLGDDQREQLKSEPADIVNSAGREGHPLQGGAFLSHFIPRDDSVPWAHLDIAGVADTEKDMPYYAKGSTGWGVRTLVNWVTSRAER